MEVSNNGVSLDTWTSSHCNIVCSRNFMPQLKDFFEDAIEQADPEAMIEENYK